MTCPCQQSGPPLTHRELYGGPASNAFGGMRNGPASDAFGYVDGEIELEDGSSELVDLEFGADEAVVTLDEENIEPLSGREVAAAAVGLASPVVILAATAITAKRTKSTAGAVTVGLVSWLGLSFLHKTLKAPSLA